MNTNELADALVNTDYTPLKAECATMLHQLQAENEELKTMRGNSVLVPSDKLKELQDERNALKVTVQKFLDYYTGVKNEQ